MSDLLPPNATPFEKAMSEAMGRVSSIQPPLRPLWDPETCPESHLPWLAWTFSVDYWDDEWPIERKRYAVKRAVWLHQHKGTLGGIAAHVEMAGYKVIKAITPPAKTFLMPRLTDEERERYLAMFAQLRVYPFVERAVGKYRAFIGRAGGQKKMFVGHFWLTNSEPKQRYIRTAKLWDHGVETDLTIRGIAQEEVGSFHAAEYDEVILPAQPSPSIFIGSFNAQRRTGKMFLVDGTSVKRRVVRIPRGADYTYRLGRETYTTVYPDADLINVEPRKVMERHTIAQKGTLFCGGGKQFIGDKRSFLPPSQAWRYIYEQWHLHDPDRVPEQRKRSTYMGHTRFGMPPFNAELTVQMRTKRPARQVGRFLYGFLVTSELKNLKKAREAIVTSKAVRDKILVQPRTLRPPRPSDRLKLGSIAIGQLIEG